MDVKICDLTTKDLMNLIWTRALCQHFLEVLKNNKLLITSSEKRKCWWKWADKMKRLLKIAFRFRKKDMDLQFTLYLYGNRIHVFYTVFWVPFGFFGKVHLLFPRLNARARSRLEFYMKKSNSYKIKVNFEC